MKDSCKTKKRNGLPWQFNPYEIAFCGYSNSGKTTLITRLIERLSKEHKLAYIKHDGHKFDLDKEGKDTYRAREAGAAAVYINDENKTALQCNHLPEKPYLSLPFLDYDFVLIEGYKKKLKMPKIAILDEDLKILDLYKDEDAHVLAYVGSSEEKPKELAEHDLYFQRDQIVEIEALILDYFKELTNDRPVNGLVLVGGHSTRMKTDKASLEYHGMSQAARSASLLEKYCDQVFLSCREDQELPEDCQQYSQIPDSFLNMGPAGGILSAFKQESDSTWLVMGCDLPFVEEASLDTLTEGRNAMKTATAFISTNDGFPEPLLALYEPKARSAFFQTFASGFFCPRKMLINKPTALLEQDKAWLENINTPEEFQEAQKEISDKKA